MCVSLSMCVTNNFCGPGDCMNCALCFSFSCDILADDRSPERKVIIYGVSQTVCVSALYFACNMRLTTSVMLASERAWTGAVIG